MDNKHPEKYQKCRDFFDRMAELLSETHEVMGSCNKDLSAYLVPIGTGDQVTYGSKPVDSFRVSDHWNWYANLKKNPDPTYIQCWSVDAPPPKKRPSGDFEKATMPRFIHQVAYFGEDGKYHHVYGDKCDPVTKERYWVESTPEEVLENLSRGFKVPDYWDQYDIQIALSEVRKVRCEKKDHVRKETVQQVIHTLQ